MQSIALGGKAWDAAPMDFFIIRSGSRVLMVLLNRLMASSRYMCDSQIITSSEQSASKIYAGDKLQGVDDWVDVLTSLC